MFCRFTVRLHNLSIVVVSDSIVSIIPMWYFYTIWHYFASGNLVQCFNVSGNIVFQAFLYAVVRSAAIKQGDKCGLVDSNRPLMLPSAINELLCTVEQQNWWTSVYKLTTNTSRFRLFTFLYLCYY